jgi:hypothetical protein
MGLWFGLDAVPARSRCSITAEPKLRVARPCPGPGHCPVGAAERDYRPHMDLDAGFQLRYRQRVGHSSRTHLRSDRLALPAGHLNGSCNGRSRLAGFPFFAVTLLAGLQGISAELYEAASLDGASTAGKFWHVTLPGLAGVIATALLLRMIWVANSLDLILVMTGGGPGTATLTLPLHAMLTAWSGGNFGKGSALAVILTLILLGGMIFSLLGKRKQ